VGWKLGGLRGGGIGGVRFSGFALRRFKGGFRFAQYFGGAGVRFALGNRVTGGADFGGGYNGGGVGNRHSFTAPGKARAGGAAAGKRGIESRQAGAARGGKAVKHRLKGDHRKPQASGKRGKRGKANAKRVGEGIGHGRKGGAGLRC